MIKTFLVATLFSGMVIAATATAEPAPAASTPVKLAPISRNEAPNKGRACKILWANCDIGQVWESCARWLEHCQ